MKIGHLDLLLSISLFLGMSVQQTGLDAAGPRPQPLKVFPPLHSWDLSGDPERVSIQLERVVFLSGTRLAITYRRAAIAGPGHLLVWDIKHGKKVWSKRISDTRILGLAASPNGRVLVTGNQSGVVQAWDATSGKLITTLDSGVPFRPHHDLVYSVVFSPDGKLLAVGNHQIVTVWNYETGRKIATIKGPDDWDGYLLYAPNLGFSSDGRFLAAGQGNHIRVIECASMREWARFPVSKAPGPDSGKLVVIPTSDCLVTAHSERGDWLQICDLQQRFSHLPYRIDTSYIAVMATDPSGRVLIVGAHGTVRLIGLSHGRPLGQLDEVGNELIWGVACSPDGKWVAATGSDGRLRLWSLARLLQGERLSPIQPRALPAFSKPLTDVQLQALWEDLGGKDAHRARKASVALSRSPQNVVAFIKKSLFPVKRVDKTTIRGLIKQLGSEQPRDRERAFKGLADLEGQARPFLQASRTSAPTLEQQVGVTHLLTRLDSPLPSGHLLQAVRAIAILEAVRTEEACQHLRNLAWGAPNSVITVAASHALKRIHPVEP